MFTYLLANNYLVIALIPSNIVYMTVVSFPSNTFGPSNFCHEKAKFCSCYKNCYKNDKNKVLHFVRLCQFYGNIWPYHGTNMQKVTVPIANTGVAEQSVTKIRLGG